MGVVVNNYITPDSFLMGALWFNIFILLGLLMRKLIVPVKFSVKPLFLLLILTILRMIIIVELPESITFTSQIYYPVFINFMRFEFTSHQILGLPVNVFNIFIFLWIVVAIVLVVRHIIKVAHTIPGYGRIKKLPRDEYAESILKSIIGKNKTVYVFRTRADDYPYSTMFKPYIVLPAIDFSDDILRVILMHEWKHIEDKDFVIGNIIDIVCYLFCWWNPLVYILKKNFSFARELKCDMYAVSNSKDFKHYMEGLYQLDVFEKYMNHSPDLTSKFVSDTCETADRIKVLSARRNESQRKRLIATMSYSAVICVLFVASYMFLIQPSFWESPYISAEAGRFTGEPLEPGDYVRYYRLEEIFIVDNGDDTFSLYVDGEFVKNIYGDFGAFRYFPVRVRSEDGSIQ